MHRISSTFLIQRALLFGLIVLAAASPAAAHHPLGGATPATFWHGFLSGVGHPVIGFDHLAFVVAVGLASAFVGLRYLAPLVFIGATVIGCLIALGGVAMAQLEMLIAASIVVIGFMVLSGRSFASPVYLALFAVAGLCHGGAYAAAVVGAEATPIVAYLLGFAAIQFAIAAGATWITLESWKATSAQAIQPRLAGAVVAGIGATFLVEHLEKLAFASV